jgi:hypothetical protein
VSDVCRVGDSLPHFEVETLDGGHESYSRIWQRRHLLLVCLPDEDIDEGRRYAAGLAARQPEIAACDAECLVTRQPVPGLQRPAAVVADRWGEIVFVAGGGHVWDLPPVDDLLDWLRYVQNRCPECEGEAR